MVGITERQIEELKKQLFDMGIDDICDFVGTEVCGWDKDAIDSLMDEVIGQMPDEELRKFMDKYCGDGRALS